MAPRLYLALAMTAATACLTANLAAGNPVTQQAPSGIDGVACHEDGSGVTLRFGQGSRACGEFTLKTFLSTGVKSYCDSDHKVKFASALSCRGVGRAFGSKALTTCQPINELHELAFPTLAACTAWTTQVNSQPTPQASNRARPKP